uniref:DUF4283 domain-containing protein n=1 Tax=Globodera pallida TaxID=36090 RepID=A0A183CM25_GLOPA
SPAESSQAESSPAELSVHLFPEFPADDNANASSAQAVAKWVLTPRGDGLPKMLCCGLYLKEMEGLKRLFVNASEPVNFIIRLRSFAGIEPFELKNNWTGERLTFRRINKDYGLLVRCPIGREKDKWAEWEKEVAQWSWYCQRNLIMVSFGDSGIGDGPVEAEAGPSEPKKSKK